MSYLTFPTLVGLGWPNRNQEASTIVQKATSGKEVRIQNYPQNYYLWEVNFGYLDDDYLVATADFQILMGFWEQVGGMATPFLISIQNDNDTSQYNPNPSGSPTPSPIVNTVTGNTQGDGTTTTFQLARAWGGFSHLIYYTNVNNRAVRIYINSVLQVSGYSISSTGLVTFGSAPGNGLVVSADFQYYYLVRFMEDSIEAEGVAGPYHVVKSLKFYETYQ
jgi:uncharacterized protein (TIGR02217 family)